MEDANPRSGSRRRWLIGAVIAVVVVVAAVVARGRLDRSAHVAQPLVVSTAIGERRAVRLPDRTRVELNVASSIRYPATFSTTAREVTLAGEGFFVVAKDSVRPFVITTETAVVRSSQAAAFGVRVYPGQGTTRVIVDSGTVLVRPVAAPPGADMPIGAQAAADVALDGVVTRTAVDAAAYLGWRQGRISLDDVPLRAALAEVARWQNVDLRIGDSLVANRRVTATFASHQTLTEILDGIALQAGARYERDGRTITFLLER